MSRPCDIRGKELGKVTADERLSQARDVVAVRPERVVVALGQSLVLISRVGRLVLGGTRGRVRWKDGALYVLDERSGVVWMLKGLQQIGVRSVDEAYAKALIGELPPAAPDTHTAFLEAARIVGLLCRGEAAPSAAGASPLTAWGRRACFPSAPAAAKPSPLPLQDSGGFRGVGRRRFPKSSGSEGDHNAG